MGFYIELLTDEIKVRIIHISDVGQILSSDELVALAPRQPLSIWSQTVNILWSTQSRRRAFAWLLRRKTKLPSLAGPCRPLFPCQSSLPVPPAGSRGVSTQTACELLASGDS